MNDELLEAVAGALKEIAHEFRGGIARLQEDVQAVRALADQALSEIDDARVRIHDIDHRLLVGVVHSRDLEPVRTALDALARTATDHEASLAAIENRVTRECAARETLAAVLDETREQTHTLDHRLSFEAVRPQDLESLRADLDAVERATVEHEAGLAVLEDRVARECVTQETLGAVVDEIRADRIDALDALGHRVDLRFADLAGHVTSLRADQLETDRTCRAVEARLDGADERANALQARLVMCASTTLLEEREAVWDRRLEALEAQTVTRDLATHEAIAEQVVALAARVTDERAVADAQLNDLQDWLDGRVQMLERSTALNDLRQTLVEQTGALDTRVTDVEAAVQVRLGALTAALQTVREDGVQRDSAVRATVTAQAEIVRQTLGARMDDLQVQQGELAGRAEQTQTQVDALGAWLERDMAALGTRLGGVEDQAQARQADLAALQQALIERYTQIEPWARGGEHYKALALVTHHGGLWQAMARTAQEPGVGSDWLLVANGLTEVVVEGLDDERAAIRCTLADGTSTGVDFRWPVPRFRGVYDPATEYAPWDTVAKDGRVFMALKPAPGAPSETLGEWQVMTGPPGKTGKRGADGPALAEVIAAMRSEVVEDTVARVVPILQDAFDRIQKR